MEDLWIFLVYNVLWLDFFLLVMRNFISYLNYKINWEMPLILEIFLFVADMYPNGIFISSWSHLNAWYKNNKKNLEKQCEDVWNSDSSWCQLVAISSSELLEARKLASLSWTPYLDFCTFWASCQQSGFLI